MGARSRRRERRAAATLPAVTEKSGTIPPASYPIGWWQAGFRLPEQRASAAVEACVSAISQTVAMLPLYHYRERDDGGMDVIKTSPAARVLRKPNHFQTRADFFVALTRSELFKGNGVAVATRDSRGQIDGLIPVPPGAAHPYVESTSGEVFYGVGFYDLLPDPPVANLWPARDVLHIRLHTAYHPLLGVTPLTSAALAVASAGAINTGIAAFMTNLVRPSGFLAVPQGVTLSKEVQEQLRSDWTDNASGVNAGRLGVLSHGIEWKPMKMDAFDEAVVKAYAMNTADIARVFRVPLPIINELGGATFNNAETLIRHWHATGLGFMLEHIELALDAIFELPPNEFIAFDVEYIMRSDFPARMDALAKAVLGGIYAPNEARRKEGLPAAKDGDEPRLQAQVVPLSAASAVLPAAPSAPAPAPADPEGPEDPEDSADPEDPEDAPDKSVEGAAVRLLNRMRRMADAS